MPDHDLLALDIHNAILMEAIGQEARKAIRSLSEEDRWFMGQAIANHLRRGRWRQLPPEPHGAPGWKGPKSTER